MLVEMKCARRRSVCEDEYEYVCAFCHESFCEECINCLWMLFCLRNRNALMRCMEGVRARVTNTFDLRFYYFFYRGGKKLFI